MARFGFVGPSYTSQSVIADNQRTLNWFPEADGSGAGKSAIPMYPCPGLSRFCTLPDSPVRALIASNGRCFAVGGSEFYEILSDGMFTAYGAVANDGLPASMAASPDSLLGSAQQVMLASGQHGYCFTLNSNTFTSDPANLVSPLIVQYCDGFFVSLQANSNKFQYSTSLDGTSWDSTNKTAISVFPDNVTSFIVDRRDVIIQGQTKSVVYYDSGNVFTFDVVPGSTMGQGIGAAFCRDRIDNTLFFLGNDELGGIVAWRLQGYIPTRISTHAIETTWRGYSQVSDAVSYAWGWNGHSFWQIYFPSANSGRGATWVYDVATQMWHERCYLDAGEDLEFAHKSQCHVYAFGKHLVGDWNSGNIYEMNDTFLTDDGNNIKRLRRAPHISNEAQRIYHNSLQIDVEVGLGPQPALTDGAGAARDPQMTLRWSDDGGKTWSNGRTINCGQAGKYLTRAIERRLGQSRDRVYEISTVDPVAWRVIDAYLDATGYQLPTQRLQDRLRQQA